MELQFQINELTCLKRLTGDTQTREETQEIKISDGMPDIGRVLCAWGQYVIRGKEWRTGNAGVNGGVTVWVLYAPDDGSQAQCVQSWIPMSFQWDIPETPEDGQLMCHPLVRSVDARPTSGRKLMIRATVGMLAQTYIPHKITWHSPGQLPEQVYIKENVYPFCLIRDMGEKAFIIDEELVLPAAAPGLEKLIRYSLQPEVEESKVLGDKAIFRGNTLVHILYRTEDGGFASWDFDVPFSQYSQLREPYSEEAKVQVFPLLTATEMEAGEQGRLRLKAGVTGQYMVYDTQRIPIVEDAYSPEREVNIVPYTLEVPSVLENQTQRIRGEQTAPFGSSQMVDIAFYPGCCRTQRKTDQMVFEIPGAFQGLYYDEDGVMQAQTVSWQDSITHDVAENVDIDGITKADGLPQAGTGDDSTIFRGEVMFHTIATTEQQVTAASGLEVGDISEKDPKRPSVVLRRTDGESLWALAKRHGSTEDLIRQLNQLDEDPEADKMLLIPVL